MPAQPAFNSIWFLSGPASASSHPLRVTDWNSQHPVTRWVRTHDVSVRNPASLNVLPTDTVLASTEGNPPVPLILAREQNGHRLLIIGFDPHDSNFPLQSAFPLLMAGGIEWMTHSVDEAADSLSTGELDLPGPATRIIAPSGKDVPFARKGPDVHLLATETGMYRLIAPNGETSVAVNTPAAACAAHEGDSTRNGGRRIGAASAGGLGSVALAGAPGHRRAVVGMVALLFQPGEAASGARPGNARRWRIAKYGSGTREQNREQSEARNPNFVT